MNRKRIRVSAAPIALIPAEMLIAIALLLPLSAQARLLRTCKRVFHVVSRIVYKDVDVVGHGARLLCMTLVPRKYVYGRYVELVQTFVFTGGSLDDLHLTYPMLTDAMVEMIRLKSLTLSIPQAHTLALMTHLRSKGIIRTTSSPFLCLASVTNGADNPMFSRNTLPSLRTLNVFGDSKLFALASHRMLTEIYIGLPVSITVFSQIMDSVSSGRTSIPLRYFTLTLSAHASFELMALLLSLGSCCDDLRCLSVEIPSGCFNALAVSYLLSSRPVLFPKLESLAINEKGVRPSYFITPRIVSLALQRKEIESAGRMRNRLVTVWLGPIEWTRACDDYSGMVWEMDDFTDENLEPVGSLPIAMLFDSIGCFFERGPCVLLTSE